MEITSLIEVWRWLKWLPNFILKRIFNKQRMSDLVYIDIRPRYESFRIQLSEVSSYEVYFQIINMTPYEIELDRADIQFNFSGYVVSNKHIKRQTFKPGEIGLLIVQDNIDAATAGAISRLKGSNRCSVDMYCAFNCKLHSFEKRDIHLSSINAAFVGSHVVARNNA